MKKPRLSLVCFACVLLVLGVVARSGAGVSYVYPVKQGLVNGALDLIPFNSGELDSTLPGIPSKNMEEYRNELVEWGRLATLPLSRNMASFFVDENYSAGLDTSVTMGFSAEGVSGTHTYFDINRPLWKMMRDILFLEQLKKSVDAWEDRYVYGVEGNPGEVIFYFHEAYERALAISEQYESYLEGTGGESSPLIAAIIGAGGTSYFTNLLQSDGALEDYVEGKALDFLENGRSMFKNGVRDALDLNAAGAKQFLTSAGIEFIKQNTGKDVGLMLDVAENVGMTLQGTVSGGLGAVLGPVLLYNDLIGRLVESASSEALGAHIALHHLLARKYPGVLEDRRVFDSGGALKINHAAITQMTELHPVKEAMTNYWRTHQTAYDFPTTEEALHAYSVSSLFQFAQSLDIPAMKKNIAAYVILKAEEDRYLKDPVRLKLKRLSDEYKTYASLADRIYGEGFETVGKFDPLHPSEWDLVFYFSPASLQAGLYKKSGTDEYIIAFGGTTSTASDYNKIAQVYDVIFDIGYDLTMLSNFDTIFDQTKQLMDFLDTETIKPLIQSGKIKGITGHSLGGGLATFAGLYLGIETCTFNSAPLPFTENDVTLFEGKGAVEKRKNGDHETVGYDFPHKDKIIHLSSLDDPMTNLNAYILAEDKDDDLIDVLDGLKLAMSIPLSLSMDYILPGEQDWIPLDTGHSMTEIYDALRFEEIVDNSSFAALTLSLPAGAGFDESTNTISTAQGDAVILYLNKYFWGNHRGIRYSPDEPFQIGYERSGDGQLSWVDAVFDSETGGLRIAPPVTGAFELVRLKYSVGNATETVFLPAEQSVLGNSGSSGDSAVPVVRIGRVWIDSRYWTGSNGMVKKAIAEWKLSRALDESASFRIGINGVSTTVTVAPGATSGQFYQFEKMFSYTIFTNQVTAALSDPSNNIEISQINGELTLENVSLGASVVAEPDNTPVESTVRNVDIIADFPRDNTLQTGAFTKTWRFVQDISSFSVQVLGSTFASHGTPFISGNMVTLSLMPGTSNPVNKIELQLKDGGGRVVKVSNSDVFRAINKTNHLPALANGQQTQMVGGIGETLSLDVETYDADNDPVTLAVADADGGSVHFSGNRLQASFSDDKAVHTIKITLGDGKEEVVREIVALRFGAGSISGFYGDLDAVAPHFEDIAFATLKGVVGGQPDGDDDQRRIFRANDDASWAEALAMVLNAASISGKIALPDSGAYLTAFPAWAMPYYTFAREKGALTFQQSDLSTIYPSREAIAMLLVKSLGLDEKLARFPELPLTFSDEDEFSSGAMNRHGQIVRFFGLFMTSGQASPAARVSRGELAGVITRIFMMPSAEINVPVSVEFGEPFDIGALTDVRALTINDLYELVDASAGLTVEYAINRRIVDPAAVNVSALSVGSNTVMALIENNGVRDFISKRIEATFTDGDSDGVQDARDPWSDDFRYQADTNGNGIPDILDEVLGLSDKSVGDTASLGQHQATVREIIEKGGFSCPQTQYVATDPGTGERKVFATPCDVPSGWPASVADTIPPTLIVPSGITVDSTGYLTPVDPGPAVAADNIDGNVVPIPDKRTFRPGAHTLKWTAVDSSGNTATATQAVHVVPQVNMTIDGMAEEGGVYVLEVALNGNPVAYPVTVPYAIDLKSSTADENDHDLLDGELEITEASGLRATREIHMENDDDSEGIEYLAVRLGTPVNAVKGKRDLHFIAIVEDNIAPRVTINARQDGAVVNRVSQDRGPVTITARIQDVNALDSHSCDWSQSHEALLAPADLATAQWQIDPDQLDAGEFYPVKLSVSDGSATVHKEVLLMVDGLAPVLDSDLDTDGDGIADADEGAGDSDDDGIPDYLDDRELTPELVAVLVGGKKTAIETTPGLKMRLGVTAQKAGHTETMVSADDIGNYADALSADTTDDYENVGGLFDFIVSDLPMPGFSIPVVLPQTKAIPADAVYRKYDEKSGWKDFVVTGDTTNQIYSAPGELGVCPPPDDASYVAGLAEGDYCVKLLIEDGGPNDADGLANGEVNDPGGVAILEAVTAPVAPPASGGFTPPSGSTDDVPATPEEVEISPVEGDGNRSNHFLLQIHDVFDHDVSVDYATREGTATAGSDFIAETGTATIKKGELSTVMSVVILGDVIKEEDEYFYLVLTNPQGASFAEGVTEITARRTIVDDDH